MQTKDGRDTPIEKLTPELYIVPRGEEKDYHAVIEVEQYDSKTGRKLSKPRLQKFGRKAFESHVEKSLRKQGYKITILHNPTEWLKAQQAKAAQKATKVAEAKAQARAEEKAALKAEIIAELQAAGVIPKAEPEPAENKPKRGKNAKQEQETE